MTTKAKPTYEELERRIQKLEKIESELEYSREMLRVYEKASLGYQSLDENGHYIAVNQTWLDTLGYAKEEVIGKSFADFIHPEWRDHFKENFPKFKSFGEILGAKFKMVKKNGEIIQVSLTGKISRDEKGNFHQTHCIFHDITEQKQAEEALKDKTQLLQNITDNMFDLVSLTDMKGNFTFLGASHKILKYDLEYLIGKNVLEFIHPEDLPEISSTFNNFLLRLDDGQKAEYRYRCADGIYIWLETVGRFIRDDKGNPKEILFSSRAITERKKAEQALKDSEEKHRRLFETMSQGVIYQDSTGAIISANPAAERILGLSLGQMLGKTSMDPRWKIIREDGSDVPGNEHPAMQALQTGQKVGPVTRGVFHPDKDTHIWLSITAIPLFQPVETTPFQAYATIEDITEQKQAEQKLIHSHNLIRYVIEHMRSAVAVHDKELNYIYVSQRYLEEYKVQEQDIIGKHHYDVFPDLPQKWRAVHKRALAGEVLSAEDDPYFREDGSVDWTRWECRPWYEADGSIGGIIIYTEVITDRKKAEEEKEKLQAQFIQAQKMESIGRLAGGVAHDINNKLLIISGYAELIQESLEKSDPSHDFIEEIINAGQKSTNIIEQLLAFARKQTISPRVIPFKVVLFFFFQQVVWQ